VADPRHEKLAQVLVRYSLDLQPGQRFGITAGPPALPLVQAVYREALRAGAHPEVRIVSEDFNEIRLREGSEDQLRYVSEITRHEMEYFDATLSILSSENTKRLSGIDPRRMALVQEARATLTARFMERAANNELRWCATLFPTQAHAQDAGMSLSAYEDFVFGAGLLDHDDPATEWRKINDEQQRIADFLGQHDEIHIVAPGTDLTYRVGGRTWINASGLYNFPDGEVFTGPIEDSANGTVRFTYPAVYFANEVEDVRLTFENGKVVTAEATRGLDFLHSMLDMDSGARFLGEVAFGLNYGITQFTRNTLFDEKIGGTMHMALGKSYPETGGVNTSGLHWDMVSDLREGKVYVDGTLCYEGGRFII
jgi:aminopeptidase